MISMKDIDCALHYNLYNLLLIRDSICMQCKHISIKHLLFAISVLSEWSTKMMWLLPVVLCIVTDLSSPHEV